MAFTQQQQVMGGFMSNVDMMGGGPAMEGNWFNPQNGDYFTVRDCFFENDDIVVMTTDGRRVSGSIIEQYIQTKMSKAELELQKKEIQTSKQRKQTSRQTNTYSDIPAEVLHMIDTGEDDMNAEIEALTRPFSDSTQTTRTVVEAPSKTTIKDEEIISRALSNKDHPELSINFSFTEVPEKELMMLLDIMKVSAEDIATWYFETYFKNDYKDIIINIIASILTGDSKELQVTQTPVESITEEKTKSKKKKPK